MRTPINKESFEDAVIKRDRADVDFISKGFFAFTKNKKRDGVIGDISHIGVITCIDAYRLNCQIPEGGYVVGSPGYDFCFDDPLPVWGEHVEEGDIINIRTEIDLVFPSLTPEDNNPDESLYADPANDPSILNTFLVTFLIELDPL